MLRLLLTCSLLAQAFLGCVNSSRIGHKNLGPKQTDPANQPQKKVDASKLLVTYAKANSLTLGAHRSLDLKVKANGQSDYVSYRISELESGHLVKRGRIYFGAEVFSNLQAGKLNIELAACVEQGREINARILCGKKTSLLYLQEQNPDPVLSAMLDSREDLSRKQKKIGSDLSNLSKLFLSQTDLATVAANNYEIVALSAVLSSSSHAVLGEMLERSDEIIPKISLIQTKLEERHQQLKLTSDVVDKNSSEGDESQSQNEGVNLAEGAAMLYVVGSLLRTFDSGKNIEANASKRAHLDKMIAALDLTIDAKNIQIQDLEKMTAKVKEKIDFEKAQSVRHNGYIDTLNENIRDFEILKSGFVSEKNRLDQDRSNFLIDRMTVNPGKWDNYARYGKRIGLMISVGLVLLTNFDERVAGQIDRNISLFSFWLSEDPFEQKKHSFLISIGSLFKKLVDLKSKSIDLEQSICMKIKCQA